MNPVETIQNFSEGPEKKPFFRFLHSFDDPFQVAHEILELIDTQDEYVAPPDEFFRRPNEELFENWEYPVCARTFHDEDNGWLLCLPPGSNRFSEYRRIMPTVMERQLERNFPRLKAELANRPNLLFPGVFYPDEIEIQNMEMISRHHGRNYVVRADLEVEGDERPHTVVLKPTPMGVEAVITSTFHELNRRMPAELEHTVGPIRVPSIVSMEDRYGILEYIPGQNGVEALPDGINTGTIHTLKTNEYPVDFDLSRKGLLELADEFAKQAVTAFYLRLYDRKPDQFVFNPLENGRYRITHIDFGRSIKKNFAIPWKRYYATQRAPLVFEDHEIPYFEAAASLIFLPHYIPNKLKEEFPPFEGKLRRRIKETFVSLAHFFQKNVEVIEEHFQYLVGEKTQFDPNEVHHLTIRQEDVEEVNKCLLSLDPPPEEIFESIMNLAIHEHRGSTPTISDRSEDDESIYRRLSRPGGDSRKLAPEHNGNIPYAMVPYREGGQVYYDRDRQTLHIHFGRNPERVIEHVRSVYAPRLAEFIEQFPDIKPGVSATVFPDGSSRIRIPPGLVREDVTFPSEAIQQFRQVVSGFAPTHHVQQYIDNFHEWRKQNPEAHFIQEETQKQTIAFANNLEGKEILQSYQLPGEESQSIHHALREVIRYMLSNPDYLADKDPVKSINQLVMSLGQKYELVSPLDPDGRDAEGLPHSFAERVFSLYNNSVPTEYFAEKTPPHVIHVRIMLELSRFFAEKIGLSLQQKTLLLTATALHDLNVLKPEFGQLLSDPNGRLNRPIFEDYLLSHTDLTIEQFKQWEEHIRPIPKNVESEALFDLLQNHHNNRDSKLHQLLHVVDNLAVFSDNTRPGHWNRGYLRLGDLAPHWLEALLNRGTISEKIYQATLNLFEDQDEMHEILDYIDRQSHDFPALYNALQMGSALHHGLDPQNPGLLDELRDRHGAEIVDGIWSRALRSYLPVGEKIRVIRRLDELARLFSESDVDNYAFTNASPRPIQLAVELIRHHLEENRTVILMGIFPRVTKAYRRFLDQHGDRLKSKIEKIVAIAGPRRLQFIRHSYPFEADFQHPFHQIIQTYRKKQGNEDNLCLIPFDRFHRSYAPTIKASQKIRQLEKVSELEELHTPERVETEAQRYRLWKKKQAPFAIDTLENERFRRILLNDFTNREVLYFYRSTIDDRPNVQIALKEVIGALRENPNYLSERSSRYTLHELVRSLSQIHFFGGEQPKAYNVLQTHLQHIGVKDPSPYFKLLDRYGDELNFFKNTLATGLQIMEEIAEPNQKLPMPAMTFALLGYGIIAEEEGLSDYLLSPEDISYNRAIRRRLVSHTVRIAERVMKTEAYKSLPENQQKTVKSLLLNARPALPYALSQSALYLAMYLDYSRVENWERGRRIVTHEDVHSILRPLERMLPRHVSEEVRDRVLQQIRETIQGPGIDRFNQHARPTYSYIYLFNALSLARDLRYGLFPGGHNPFQNVRLLYGVQRTDRLLQGMVYSDLSAPEAVKICRKIRYLASALKRHPYPPTDVHFLNLDRTGSWQLPELEKDEQPMLILSGDLLNCLQFWEEVREKNPEVVDDCYTLIGEEFPVLLKETSLAYTNFLEERIAEFRKQENRVGRHLMIPVQELFRNAPERPEPVVLSYRNLPPGLFINAWLALFDL